MIPKATIIVPIFNLIEERLRNFTTIISNLILTDIPTIVAIQVKNEDEVNSFNLLLDKIDVNKKITLMYEIIDSDFIHKSLLINKASEIIETKYIWVLDADVFLDYKKIYSIIDDQDVIKPFKKVIRLTEEETVSFINSGSIRFKKGSSENITKIFGPLSFIIKKTIFEKENMNEKFKGWGWEDLEFASRIMERYQITEINVYGLHLFHPRNTANEKQNREIFNKECKGSEVYKKSAIEDMNKSLVSDENGIISQVDQKKNTDITIPLHIQHQSRYILDNDLLNMDFDWKKYKLKLEDCSIVIPVRIDTSDRLHNLKIVLNYFNDFFTDFELIVIEHDKEPKLKELIESFKDKDKIFKYINRQTDGSFHKTFNFNLGISVTSGKYIAAYDCDSIFNPLAIFNAFKRLKDSHTNFIFPYNRYMVQIKRHVFNGIDRLEPDFISDIPIVTTGVLKDTSDYEVLYGSHDYECTGGALFFNKVAFFMNGGYNPNIISYGCEDNEIELRVKRLGNIIERLDSFNCYHLEHGRSVDSHYNNFFPNNEREYTKIKDLPKDELRKYVDNGFKHTVFDTKKALNIVNNENEYSIKLDNITEKFDLSDVDIIIPTFIDFHDRIRNLEAVLKQLEKFYCNYNVILIELESMKAKYLYHKVGIQYHNYQEKFNKTRAINLALEKCDRKFVCVWDVDALIPRRGVEDAMISLRDGSHKIAYPYNGWFLDIDNDLRDSISKTLDFSKLPLFDNNNNDYKIENLEIRFSTRFKFKGGGNNGGCVFMDRETLKSLGNYNENFYQWGYEDDEIEQRFEIMGFPRYNSPNANCFHMVHRRVESASIRGDEFFKINHREFNRVTSMNKETLEKYIKNGFHLSYDSISVVLRENDCNENIVKHYESIDFVSEIIVPTDSNISDAGKVVFSNDPESSKNQILLFPRGKLYTENEIEKYKNEFEKTRRLVVVDEDEYVFVRKDFYQLIKDGDYKDINKIEIEINSSIKKASIILTTYGKETLSSKEYLDRFMNWKNNSYELIVVVHDETPAHRAILEFCKSIGVIDKIIYATKDHGHVRGLALGSSKAESEIIIIANNDVRISQKVIDDCIEAHKDPQLGVIGWHYNDFPNHEGTFWKDGTLQWNSRTGKIPELLPEEVEKIKDAEWYTGRVFDAIGEKRLLLCNGSFFAVKKKLWEKLGGFNPDKFSHYFSDDYFCYGVLDQGYDIKNLPKEYRCSQLPEIFESLSDLEFKGKQNPFKGKDYYNIDTNKDSKVFEFVYDALNHPKVCLIGSKPVNLYTLPIDYCSNTKMDEKVDIMVITEPVSDHRIARNRLNEGGWIFCYSKFADSEYENIDRYSVYTKISLREEFKIHNFNKQNNKKEVINGVIKKKENSKKRFVMLTQTRVGFTCLKILFDKHSQIYLDQAIFGNDNMSLVAKGISGNKLSNPERFVNSFFDLSSIETTKDILGFRFKTWDEPVDFVSKSLIKMDDVIKIIITRENLLKSVVDCAFAHKTGIWHTTTEITSYPDIEVDVDWARGWMIENRNIINSWRECFDINGIQYLNVTYEELFYGNKIGLDKIYKFLGAKKFKMPFPLKPTFNDEALKHIKNKDELNKLFGKDFGYLE